MVGRILQIITGKDDLERVAAKEDLSALNRHLETRRVIIPRRPQRYLDASNHTKEQLREMVEAEAANLAGDSFEPWVLETDGKGRLPVFSNAKRIERFSATISQRLNKVFALGHAECLLWDITKDLELDFVDLNLFSEKSWEIRVTR